DHCQADAGVAAGRLDDRAAGLERAGFLGILDHRQCDAVLDRAGGIGALALHPHLVVGEQAGEANVRGVPDGGEDAVGLHVGDSSCLLSCRNVGANVLALRSSGKIQAQSAVTTTAPAPPKATAPTAPSTPAISPARNSPSSLEAEMARPEMAETRPRIASGVLSWISELRTNTEIMSAAPSSASKAIDSAKLRDSAKATVAAPNAATAH